jgi:hypothetical protein
VSLEKRDPFQNALRPRLTAISDVQVKDGETNCTSSAIESPDEYSLHPRLKNGIIGIWELMIGGRDQTEFPLFYWP